MEEKVEQEEIASKYIIKEKIGSGGQANAFLVEEKETKNEYVAKVLKREEDISILNEIEILKELKKNNNPYIIYIIDSGKGTIIRKDREKRERDYFILENAKYGNIYDYIYYKGDGLGELKGKLIFSKIIEGITCCHENNICHRDIKLENILMDEKLNPKICDFGFACKNAPDLNDFLGTTKYQSPEINYEQPYDGIKSDIFNLGASLILLVAGIYGFDSATKENKFYNEIILEDFDNYWYKIENRNPGIILSDEFKDLYIQMVKFKPEERILTNKILEHPWFKELEDYKQNEEKMKELNNEIRTDFDDLFDLVKGDLKNEINIKNIDSQFASYNTKSVNIDYNEVFFKSDLEPKYDNTPMNIKNCIKIKGYLDANSFMNNLCNLIINNYGVDNCYLEPDKKNLKFEAFFEKDKDNENDKKKENDDNDEDKIVNELNMKIKLYKCSDGHILRFKQIKGNRKDFLDKFNEISKLVKKYYS